MYKRTVDHKERNLIIIERNIKDNPNLPTYKTFYAGIRIDGKKNPKLKKIGSCREGLSIAVMRERVREEIKSFHKLGDSSLTIDNFFYEFYKPSLENNNRKTISEIESLYIRNIKNNFGDQLMIKVQADIIYKWFLDLSSHSKGTANHSLSILKAMYNLAIKFNQAKINPADKITKNKIASRRRYFTEEERKIFLSELRKLGKESPYGSAFIYLAYLTGARKGELAKAKWEDLKGNTIILKEHKTDDKTDNPRIIYLNEEAMELIRRLPRDKDTILGIKNPDRQWKKLINRSGIKNFRFHDLRHNFGSQSMNMGISMIRVGELMGHTSIKAMQIYQTPKPETLNQDIEKIGNYLIN